MLQDAETEVTPRMYNTSLGMCYFEIIVGCIPFTQLLVSMPNKVSGTKKEFKNKKIKNTLLQNTF